MSKLHENFAQYVYEETGVTLTKQESQYFVNLCMDAALSIGTSLNNRCIESTDEYRCGKFDGVAEYMREIKSLKEE